MWEQFAAWVEEYSLPLLRWARGKTGDPTAAEDLAQEVWLQFFSAAGREAEAARAIARPEHLLWKIARDLHELSLSRLPPHLKHLAPLAEAMAQYDMGYVTELMAFRDGTLYQPVDKRDGEFLTMAYIQW